MKICPTCRRTYDDDGLNFCLEDGSVLTLASPEAAPTVVMDYPRPTSPRGERPTWETQDQTAYSMQPKKKSSKTWVWVLGIFAILILVCGGGFVGFFLYVASIANSNANITKGATNTNNTKGNTFTRTTPTPGADDLGDATEIDMTGWVEQPTVWLESEYSGDEFFMTSKQKGYYYVLVAKNSTFSASKATRVTVRNPDGANADLGYGLIFYSDTTPLSNDYAFLIDSMKKKYRVVRHENEEETTITTWTNSNLIKSGTEPNVLEARNTGDKIELFINGQRATSITNKLGPKSGVPGLYVGAGAKIGFSKLEIVK